MTKPQEEFIHGRGDPPCDPRVGSSGSQEGMRIILEVNIYPLLVRIERERLVKMSDV